MLIGDSPSSRSRQAAGSLAVAALKALRILPPSAGAALFSPLLPLYRGLIRPGQTRRLKALFAASPFAGRLTPEAYYRSRLELLWRCLDLHGRPLRGGEIRVQGMERYREASASGRPVALLGLHLGVVELLHRLPPKPAGRPFRVITAPAFSSALTGYMRAGRELDGKQVLQNRDLLPGLREVLRDQGAIAFMLDQFPDGGGETLKLWGRLEIPYPAGLLRMLAGRGCALLPVCTWLAEGGTMEYRFETPWPDADPERARAFLEAAVARAPEQWNWSYPRLRIA